ncbi:U5 small nuclear ribonucleo 40 kDa -like [Paramuricea clavata]|uniref:U5 small nuclear ribonucleo 40 kDa -like n=1 Tax=Paramuricea clavata TaxID=317549 RepID=A0A7D9HU16_PARCT|nr:U5 small nuclear ribonucleo 40 kDa -like [Paramuricea clavata]
MTRKTEQLLEICILKLEKVRILEFMIVEARISFCNLVKCSWSPDGKMIAAGSADRFVYVWDTQSRRILYKLPGHDGSVNDVDFHPKEPILLSVGSDRKIYLGELHLR